MMNTDRIQHAICGITDRIDQLRQQWRHRHLPQSVNISHAVMQRAAVSTAEYVEARMLTTPVFTTDLALHRSVMSRVPESGLVLEFGVATGRTLRRMARTRPDARFVGFDSWQGLPTSWTWMFPQGSFAQPRPRFREPNIETRQGWFEDTLPAFVRDLHSDVSVLHMDMDQYAGCRTVLEHLQAWITPGVEIMFDEYFNYPGWQQGEYLAWQEFVTRHGIRYEYVARTDHQQVVVRVTARQTPESVL